jgi:hypothetical protein
MELMSNWMRWWARLGVVVSSVVAVVLAPALAWAQERPAVLAVADEIALRRPRRGIGFGGFLGSLCCLAVVLVAVVVLVLVIRGRSRQR